jgi:glyoxylase-like metal-dependent hydrolase (beta-lactamase superfamily II)
MIVVNEYLSHLECSEEPLSADVYLIRGDKYTYVVDVGNCAAALNLIESVDRKQIIITHFHPDHMGNLQNLEVDEKSLYVGDYTGKVLGYGRVVKEPVLIRDGVEVKICPIPNSHAKGALCVLTGQYLLVGDSIYCSSKGYNVSLLHDEIDFLKNLDFRYLLMSHDNTVYEKAEILERLQRYYGQRGKDDPYILPL